MAAEAPKTSTVVDDFRTEQLDLAQWTYSGTLPTIYPHDTASAMRGLLVPHNTTISSVNTAGGRRADLFNSECVWVVGQWGTGTQCIMSLTQGNYSYSFLFLNGTLTLRAIENGVTTTEQMKNAANVVTNTWGYIRYLRIAHSATTGRVEFFAGRNPDGSDQQIMNKFLAPTPPASAIDNMIVSMSRPSGTITGSWWVRAVNAPAGGLRRSPEDPKAYYVRNFNTWYARIPNQYHSVVDTMSHEWKTMAVNSSSAVQVIDTSLTNRVMQIAGDGANRTILRTGFTTTIKDVSFETVVTPLSLPDSTSYFGMHWRTSNDGAARYQLNVSPVDVTLNAYYLQNGTYTAVTSPRTQLISVPLETVVGATYTWRVSHYDDRIRVTRDGVEVLNFTELVNYVRVPGHIGFDVGNLNAATTADTIVAIDSVKVVPGYDESGSSPGITLQNRGLGAHVKQGRRDQSPVTMAANPGVLSDLESSSGLNFKTVYHFTNYSNTVDTGVISAAQAYANQGRVNVIAWNSFASTHLSQITSGAMNSVIDAWAAAFDGLSGTTYVAPLPFPDLNVGWSPFAYTYTNNVTSSTSTTITRTSPGWTTNQFAGGSVRWQANDGTMKYATVTSNTTTTITFASNGFTPTAGNKFWVRTSGGGGTATQYVNAYRYIVNRMRAQGVRVSFVFAMNWASDTDTLTNAAYTQAFDDLYPGNDYVDSFLIRAINTGLGVQDAAAKWRSISQMLQGGSYTGGLDYIPASGQTVYYKMNAADSNKKMFLVTGTAETHHRFNNFEHGFGGADVTIANSASATNDGFDSMSFGTGGSIKYWIPPSINMYNPNDFSAGQRAIRFLMPTAGDDKYGQWDLPTSGVTRLGVSAYFKTDDIGAASEAGFLIEVRDASAPICKVRLNGSTGQITLTNAAGSTIGTLSTPILDGIWYRIDLDLSQSESVVKLKITQILNANVDRPDSFTSQATVSSFSINTPRYVRVGSTLSNQTYNIRSGFEVDSPKVSWDTTAETYSKARWLVDAMETRGYGQISSLILMSGDMVNDITTVNSSRFGGNSVDTRLDASKHTLAETKKAIHASKASQVHTRSQLRPAGFQPSAEVGNVEYMYLEEFGRTPLQIVPRVGGLLLRDFDLGVAPARVVSLPRPAQDGTFDHTRYVGAKPVSLQFVVFDDASGSAAFYQDLLSIWASPRSRPTLVYKMKDGDERRIKCRPETHGGMWTVDGIRSGFKEVGLQFAGYEGKAFSTAVNEVIVPHGVLTEVNTPGSVATPPIIRVYGGTSGCLNPTIALISEEQKTGGATARIGIGNTANPVMVPASTFLEIDMGERTIQLNGLPYRGMSYLPQLIDRQWFSLEPYYNMIYFESDDTNGFAAVRWRDAHL